MFVSLLSYISPFSFIISILWISLFVSQSRPMSKMMNTQSQYERRSIAFRVIVFANADLFLIIHTNQFWLLRANILLHNSRLEKNVLWMFTELHRKLGIGKWCTKALANRMLIGESCWIFLVKPIDRFMIMSAIYVSSAIDNFDLSVNTNEATRPHCDIDDENIPWVSVQGPP